MTLSWQFWRATCRRALLVAGLCSLLVTPAILPAQERENLREPVYRVSKAKSDTPVDATPQHPLDPALELAKSGLKTIREGIRDYECVLVKRERISGKLNDYEYMFTKVRSEQRAPDGQVVVPFSVYMYFLEPSTIKGREVLYVAGQNDDKLIAHEGSGITSRFGSVWLRPDGPLAMKGQLYPLTDVGLENLVVKLLEKGERDRQRGECEVKFHKNANINGRQCTMLEVMHPEPRPYFDFHIAQIFIDDEHNVPIRYAAYLWPEVAGGKPVLLEEYTYLKLKLNVGLTDKDFDPTNPNYRF